MSFHIFLICENIINSIIRAYSRLFEKFYLLIID